MKHILLLTGALALAGCLTNPELKDCAEFEFGTEGCGTPCEVYCDFMVYDCGEVYESRDRCMNDCANEPVSDFVDGDLGATTGNSLACRLTYALEGECQEASLRNSTQCIGESCDDYCDLMLSHCEGAYPSRDNCLSTCEMLPRGRLGVDANTVECRFGYAELSADDAAHCNAASAGGGNVCGEVCEVYCDMLDLNCTGENTVYDSRASCEQVCGLMYGEGSFDDWSFDAEIDSVQCRLYHAGPPATLEPGTHCPHAGVYNAMHCGIDPQATTPADDWPCPTYCDLVLSHCPGVYGSEQECKLDCATFPEVLTADPAFGPDIYPVSSRSCPM